MRRTFPVLWAGAIATVMLLRMAASPALARSSWACAPTYYATCYSPSQVHRAERSLPVTPVNPSQAVFQSTHLRLARVTISRDGFKMPPNAIFYSYGVALALDQAYPQNGRKYVLVVEYTHRIISFPGPQLNTTKYGTRLAASFRHRKMSLIVYGDLSRRTIKSIGLSILAS